jgi:hypothetical protein
MRMRNLCASVLALGLLTAACANGPDPGGAGGGSSDGISYPTSANQVILRISQGGGFTSPQYNLTTIPMFSLFGDGLLVTPGAQIEIYPGPALPAIAQQRLSVEAIQSLLQTAIDAGLGTDADYVDLGSVGIADAPTTTFTLTVDGQTHTTNVYALGELGTKPDGMSPDEYEARRALLSFQAKATDLSWLPEGSVSDTGDYRPTAVRVYVSDYEPNQDLTQSPIPWPLQPGLATFGAPVSSGLQGMRCGAVDGADAQTLLSVAEQANQLTPWTSEGTRYGLLFRPLLPDESGC